MLFRLGGRERTLPFGLGGADVKERAYSGGLGLPFAGGRAMADLAVQHAARTLDGRYVGTGASAVGASRERAWILSIGFTVRP